MRGRRRLLVEFPRSPKTGWCPGDIRACGSRREAAFVVGSGRTVRRETSGKYALGAEQTSAPIPGDSCGTVRVNAPNPGQRVKARSHEPSFTKLCLALPYLALLRQTAPCLDTAIVSRSHVVVTLSQRGRRDHSDGGGFDVWSVSTAFSRAGIRAAIRLRRPDDRRTRQGKNIAPVHDPDSGLQRVFLSA